MTDIESMKLDLAHLPLKKLAVAATLVVAFLFMASIFVPGRLQADEEPSSPPPPALSSEVLDNLLPLGHIEGLHYTIDVYATPTGPLYTVHDSSGFTVGELLTPGQIAQRFPDITLPDAVADVPLEMMGTDIGGR